MAIDPGVFRAYDIRGKYPAGINAELAGLLGRAFGSYVAEHEGGAEIAVGRDNRASGPELQSALIRGLVSTGATVYNIGMATSPALYFSVGHWGLAGGVNVSGSHNPPDENGFKLVGRGNRPIAGDEILAVKQVLDAGTFRSGEGKASEREIKPEYFAHLKSITKLSRRFRVAVDTGNGVAGLYAPPLLRELGCELAEIHTELDNTYPNHLPDPQMPENVVCLQEKVRASGADIGLAFDGDGDRLGVIDERGERHEAEFFFALLAFAVLNEQPGSRIIMDVKATQPVVDALTERGGKPEIWRTGHSYIKMRMRETKTPLGGEASGHIFYAENFYSDDALFAACKLLNYLSQSDEPLSAHIGRIPHWLTTPEIRVPCADDKKWEVVKKLATYLRGRYPALEIDGIRAPYPADDRWALVRASNTGPNLTLRFEAKTQAGLDAISDEVLGELRKHVQLPDTPAVGH